MSKKFLLAALAIFLFPVLALSQSHLFYLEAQAVAGYSGALKRLIFYSVSQEDTMQKPSLGIDYIQRLSGKTRDYGALALQVRLAYNHSGGKRIEPQIYNAYFNYKAGFSNLWAGHNRPALGLSSTLNSHGQLLPTLAMMGYGFDRDWGLGFSRDLKRGGLSLSFTTGSGMPFFLKGNYLFAGRISRGILAQENFSLGFSLASGKILETMGYHLLISDPVPFQSAGADWTYLWNSFESRIELMAVKKMEERAFLLFWRFGVNFLEENRLKFELQPIYWKMKESSEHEISAGISFQMNADLALRSMVQYRHASQDKRIVFQVYYYKGI